MSSDLEEDVVNLVNDVLPALLEPEEVANVDIDVNITRQSIIVTISPEKKDVGKVIGRQGRNVDALRVLLGAYCNRHNYKCHVEVAEF